MTAKACLQRLQAHIGHKQLQAYIVPKNDAFMSQNLPKHKDHLFKLSGFTGSSGFAVVRS